MFIVPPGSGIRYDRSAAHAFCSCPDGAVATKHDKHFQLPPGRLCKRTLHLICVATPNLRLDNARAFEDIEHFMLAFQIIASA